MQVYPEWPEWYSITLQPVNTGLNLSPERSNYHNS